MSFMTQKALPRRTFLRNMSAVIALPYLDAMEPAGRFLAKVGGADAPLAGHKRLVTIESVHGAAGSNSWGASKYLWAPQGVGRDFTLNPEGALAPMEAWKHKMSIISNTDVRMAEAFDAPEIGGDHFRSSAVFLTQSHPKQTQGSDLYVGTSFDQIVARKIGQDTPIPSMQLCIENLDQAGGCYYNYACAYTDTISWASPTEPLPMIRARRSICSSAPDRATPTDRLVGRTTGAFSIGSSVKCRRSSVSSAPPTADAWTSISKTCASSSAAFRRSKQKTRVVTSVYCLKHRRVCPIRSKNI